MTATIAPVVVERFDAGRAAARVDALAEVLADCVAGGASVRFMLPFAAGDARRYWQTVMPEIEGGRIALFGARAAERLLGTVQLGLATPPNQAHRADVMKLLVHRSGRRQGVARALMAALEAEARQAGRTLLTLDTMAGSAAEALYVSLGWTRVGEIPDYARFPAGPLGATVLFFKRVRGPARAPLE